MVFGQRERKGVNRQSLSTTFAMLQPVRTLQGWSLDSHVAYTPAHKPTATHEPAHACITYTKKIYSEYFTWVGFLSNSRRQSLLLFPKKERGPGEEITHAKQCNQHGKAGFEPGSLILDTELLPTSVFPSQVFSLQSTKRLLPFTSFLFINFNIINSSLWSSNFCLMKLCWMWWWAEMDPIPFSSQEA